jgi:hypothetical protein
MAAVAGAKRERTRSPNETSIGGWDSRRLSCTRSGLIASVAIAPRRQQSGPIGSKRLQGTAGANIRTADGRAVARSAPRRRPTCRRRAISAHAGQPGWRPLPSGKRVRTAPPNFPDRPDRAAELQGAHPRGPRPQRGHRQEEPSADGPPPRTDQAGRERGALRPAGAPRPGGGVATPQGSGGPGTGGRRRPSSSRAWRRGCGGDARRRTRRAGRPPARTGSSRGRRPARGGGGGRARRWSWATRVGAASRQRQLARRHLASQHEWERRRLGCVFNLDRLIRAYGTRPPRRETVGGGKRSATLA